MDTTDHGPRGPPSQANAADRSLPYPYITQFDEQQQAMFFANAETGETSWEPPNVSLEPGGTGHASSTRGMGSTPPTILDGPSPSPNGPAPAVQGDFSRPSGEAASFYAAAGIQPPPSNPHPITYDSPDHQAAASSDRAFGNEQDERAQFGKALGGSGVAAMAWNLYKKYRNGKHNKQQFRPPSGSPGTFGGGGGSSMFGAGGPSVYGGGVHNGMYSSGGMYGNSGGRYSDYGHQGRPQSGLVGGLFSALDGGSNYTGHHGPPGFSGGSGGSVYGHGGHGSMQGGDQYGSRGGHRGGPPGGFGGPLRGGRGGW